MLTPSPIEYHSRADLCKLNATEVVQGNSKPFLLQQVINNEESNYLWYMIHTGRKLYSFVQQVSENGCEQLYQYFPTLLVSSKNS